MATLAAYAIRFWSKGSKAAYFLRHEGYLGAVGAFLKLQEDEDGLVPPPAGREAPREGKSTAERRRGSLDGLLRLKRVGTRE